MWSRVLRASPPLGMGCLQTHLHPPSSLWSATLVIGLELLEARLWARARVYVVSMQCLGRPPVPSAQRGFTAECHSSLCLRGACLLQACLPGLRWRCPLSFPSCCSEESGPSSGLYFPTLF